MNLTADIALRVELPPALTRRLADTGRRASLEATLRDDVGRLTAALGVPGGIAVELAERDAARSNAVNDIRVRVGKRLCRFTQEQVARAFSLARGDVLVAPTKAQATNWLQTIDPVPFIASLAREAVARDPSVLLGPEQLALTAVAHKVPAEQGERLGAIARELLALGVSIDGLAGRAEFNDPTLAEADAAEALIAVTRAPTVDIHLSLAELRRLTLAAGDQETGKFASLRDDLFYAFGLRFSDLRFVEDDSFAPHCFAVAVNSVRGLPWVGLADNEVFVNDSAENVAAAYHVAARPAANPRTGGATFAIATSLPSGHGLSTWSPLEYMVLGLEVELRRLAPRLLDQAVVTRELDRLATRFPVLVRLARGRLGDAQLTHVLRALVSEGLSARDLQSLLMTVVDFDTIVTDPSAYIVVDDRLPVRERPTIPPPVPLLVAAIRRAHRRNITHLYTGGSWSLTVLLLDPALEREVRDRDEHGVLLGDASWCDRVLDAIADLAPAWGEDVRPPCLLTTVETRDALRRLVSLEAPHVPVLCYEDLAPDSKISVLGRVNRPEI
jgi:hypothetical protein